MDRIPWLYVCSIRFLYPEAKSKFRSSPFDEWEIFNLCWNAFTGSKRNNVYEVNDCNLLTNISSHNIIHVYIISYAYEVSGGNSG